MKGDRLPKVYGFSCKLMRVWCLLLHSSTRIHRGALHNLRFEREKGGVLALTSG